MRHDTKADHPDWLVAAPIAHRGVHGGGLVENTAEAAEAAIAGGYAIECDVQITADGEVVVFHDFTLDRLVGTGGRVRDLGADALAAFSFKDGPGRILPLRHFLDGIAGRTPVVVEIKAAFDDDRRAADRTLAVVADYDGRVALKSFDPGILAHCREVGCPCPLGIVAEADYAADEWRHVPPARRAAMRDFSYYASVRPDFLSFCGADLPHPAASIMRAGLGLPVMAWTIRTAAQAAAALRHADQIIFEGFVPAPR